MADIERTVLDAMRSEGKPLKAGEIADLTGMDKNDVSKALGKLKKDGVVASPKRCYYAPKD